MLSRYLEAALKHAKYEMIDDEKGFYAEISGFKGVYASATNLEECRNRLVEVLEEWVLFRVYQHFELPTVDGLKIRITKDLAA